MTFMQKFIQRLSEVGVTISTSGDTWCSTPVGVFTHPEPDRVLYAPNSLLDSPGMTSWISLTVVQIAKEIDPSITVYPATECFPLKIDYTEYEMEPTKVAELTTKTKNMRVLAAAQSLLQNTKTKASQIMGALQNGEAPKLILPDNKVITDV